MNGMRAHRKLKATALAASVLLLAPVAAQASSAGSTTQGGWNWWDAAIWGGALLGIVLLGLFGDLVVGAVIFGIAAVVSGGVALVAGTGLAARARAEARTERRRAGAVGSLPIARGGRQPG
jgi:predicted lipid-binding transport protein (Tim44 family)